MEKIVVVGIDGSAAAQRALDFACDEAKRRERGATRRPRVELPVSGPPHRQGRTTRAHGAGRLADAAGRSGSCRRRGVTVVAHLEEGPPVAALIDAATDAALLVVGSHGHGSVIGSLLGSTSQAVAHRANCAVALVRT